MKKKIIVLVMSLILCASFIVPAFADDAENDFDISSVLSPEAAQDLITSGDTVDLTDTITDILKDSEVEAEQYSAQDLINSLGESISDYLSLLASNKDIVFTYDPVKIFANLFDLNSSSLTTQNQDEIQGYPGDMVIGKGDVDGDGRLTAADARLILRRSAKLITFTMEQDALADVDNNGKVTAADARKVLRVSAKLETL